ncbi:MAG: carbohydrate-binding protein [Planctomycetes bacterium]|nr:carbohydrate-binding protein [Planctomycetota bacterium]
MSNSSQEKESISPEVTSEAFSNEQKGLGRELPADEAEAVKLPPQPSFDPEKSAFFKVDQWVPADTYDSTSREGVVVSRTKYDYWVSFSDFDFGEGACFLEFQMNSFLADATFEVRVDSLKGQTVVKYDIHGTNKQWRRNSCELSETIKGVRDVYFIFKQIRGYEYGIGDFIFRSAVPGTKKFGCAYNTKDFNISSFHFKNNGAEDIDSLKGIRDDAWTGYSRFDFGERSNHISIESATPYAGGRIEVMIDSHDGEVIGTIDVRHTGSNTLFFSFSTYLSREVSGRHSIYLRFVDSLGSPDMFRTRNMVFSHKEPDNKKQMHRKGMLHVYDSVPGLAASPYYRFSIQKVIDLNNPNPARATNWENPFAWYTKCGKGDAYYGFIRGWSHTYCNFELGPDTPVVIKITRLNKSGAPSGPISSAVARPIRNITSCKVIKGEVYVTMDRPALIALDIDGQLDSRDAPRSAPFPQWGPDAYRYCSEKDGAHSLTIFANPFIDRKPEPGDPGVFAVEPGTLPPKKGSWKILYFKPGVHKFSVDSEGKEREWRSEDRLVVENNKQYYIPGDAIVYGNITGKGSSESIRIFGHGTLCGTKIPHFYGWSEALKKTKVPHSDLKMMQMGDARNCVFEGITIADPAEHGFFMNGTGRNYKPNYIRWIKSITWRCNNDGAGIGGNSYMEDCFIRHQDDGLYVTTPNAVRRVIFWSDVNGCTLRLSFATGGNRRLWNDQPDHLLIEDIDILYSRALFGSHEGMIACIDYNFTQRYHDGTPNTGQHLVFRNIRVSDPRPQRILFALATPKDHEKPSLRGVVLQNLISEASNTWGSKSHLSGSEKAPFQYWVFDNVVLEGKKVDQAYLDSDAINAMHFKDTIFR